MHVQVLLLWSSLWLAELHAVHAVVAGPEHVWQVYEQTGVN